MLATINKWELFENLEDCIDSLLFDSGTIITSGEFDIDGVVYNIDLVVAGRVSVIFDDYRYDCPSEFPARLRQLIADGYGYDDSGEVEIESNNWFEYVISVDNYTESFVIETDLTKYTPQQLKEEMLSIAEEDSINAENSDKV